jgi:hypothetical protein
MSTHVIEAARFGRVSDTSTERTAAPVLPLTRVLRCGASSGRDRIELITSARYEPPAVGGRLLAAAVTGARYEPLAVTEGAPAGGPAASRPSGAAMYDSPMSESAGDYEVPIKGGSFSLSDLGSLLPGMAEIMPLIGERIWKCYYAGKAENKPLARFQLAEAVNLMQKGAILRPKYDENMEKFLTEKVEPVRSAIDAEDWAAFQTAFDAMVDSANAYHEEYDKGFLRWKVPSQPPGDLDMTPQG